MNKELLLRAKRILMLLSAATKNLCLYAPDHPQAKESVEILHIEIVEYLNLKAPLVYNIDDGQIFHFRELLVDESLSCRELLTALEARHVNKLDFKLGLEQAEVVKFVSALCEVFETGKMEFGSELRSMGIVNIDAKRMIGTDRRAGLKPKGSPKRPLRQQLVYEQSINNLSQIFDQAAGDKGIALEKVRSVLDWLIRAISEDRQAMLALTLTQTDEYLCHHSLNVSILALALAKKIGLKGRPLVWLGAGALLHDVGKAKIPRSILEKPTGLDEDEWKLVQRHPQDGAHLLAITDKVPRSAVIIAFEHHIGFDRSGYPDASGREAQHLFSRIVQIADVYDGLTSERPQRRARLPVDALRVLIESAGKTLDPALVKLFIDAVGVIPSGSVIKLSSGHFGIVRVPGKTDPLRPVISVVGVDNPKLVDLMKYPKVEMVEMVDPGAAGIDLAHELGT